MGTETTTASVAARITDEDIEKMACLVETTFRFHNTASVLRDYVRLRKLNCELCKSLKQAIDGCGGCQNIGECGSPLPFKGCKRKVEWHNLIAKAEKGTEDGK